MNKIYKYLLFISIILGLEPFVKLIEEEAYCDKNEQFENDLQSSFVDINNLPPLDNALYSIPCNQRPIILWWYPDIYPHKGQPNIIKCALGECKVSNTQSDLSNPYTRGFIFYGTSFRANDLPLPRLPHHEWALFHEESPQNNWMLSSELGISIFNHTATFRRESDYPLSLHGLGDQRWFDNTYFIHTHEKNRLQKEENLAPVVFVQRHCNPPSDRDTYITELMKYIPIDSYGPCLNNKKMPKNIDGFAKLHAKEYFHFLARYKFQIAFENAVCQDYMTEKIFRPLIIGSVPIYYGSPKIRDFMPSDKVVIVATDFENPKKLAEYLLELNGNDTLYNEYLKHRKIGKITNPELEKSLNERKWKMTMYSEYSCYICDQIYERNNMLRHHLKDSSRPIKPSKFGKYEHMGCPRPFPIIPESKRNRNNFHVFNYGEIEAAALITMLHANETDSTKWKDKYFNQSTDRYP